MPDRNVPEGGGKKRRIAVMILGFLPDEMFRVLHDHLGLTCYHCEGSGREPCPNCGGYGAGYIGPEQIVVTCERCYGDGYLRKRCSLCYGSKSVRNG